MKGASRHPRRIPELLGVLLGVLLLHVAGVWTIARYGLLFDLSAYEAPISVSLLNGDVIPGDVLPPSYDAAVVASVESEPEPEPEPEPEDPADPKGQIVETPPPAEDKVPLQSDYLAEHNTAVPEEMRSRQFKINPEILAATFSDE